MGMETQFLQERLKEVTDEVVEKMDQAITEHMEEQPYMISCATCGNPLHCTEKTVDGDSDLILKVEPCHICLAEKDG